MGFNKEDYEAKYKEPPPMDLDDSNGMAELLKQLEKAGAHPEVPHIPTPQEYLETGNEKPAKVFQETINAINAALVAAGGKKKQIKIEGLEVGRRDLDQTLLLYRKKGWRYEVTHQQSLGLVGRWNVTLHAN